MRGGSTQGLRVIKHTYVHIIKIKGGGGGIKKDRLLVLIPSRLTGQRYPAPGGHLQRTSKERKTTFKYGTETVGRGGLLSG